MLGALSRTNLFLVPLDDEGGWCRSHHLFAQLLRVEPEQREPGTAPALHRRAHAWHRLPASSAVTGPVPGPAGRVWPGSSFP